MMDHAVEAALEQLDDSTRDHARAAIEWLLPEDDGRWEELPQLSLQGFLWYQLPVKWLTDSSHHHEVAWALGDLFEAAGLSRYATLCRSVATHELISRWETDESGARKQFCTLMLDSGVDPPDTALLTWSPLQGLTEHAAAFEVSAALEAAVDDGSLVPGRRGWRSVATTVTERTLRGPDPNGEHPSLLAAIETERQRTWLADTRRRANMTDDDAGMLAATLARPLSDDDMRAVGASLEPLTWFLRQIGDGLTLTDHGYLPRQLALDADGRYGWFGLAPKFTVRGERDLPELMVIHQLARDTRLVTMRRRRLTMSARGRKALDDELSLVRIVVSHLLDPTTWEGDVALGAALALVCADPARRRTSAEFDVAVHQYLRTRWQRGEAELTVEGVRGGDWRRRAAFRAFGWFEPEKKGTWGLAPRPSPVGRHAFALGIRFAACAPHR